MRNYEMSTDHDLKALLDYGTPGFPYIRFDDDIARYKGGCIDWHWHDQLEFVLVTSNSIICDIDGITLTVP